MRLGLSGESRPRALEYVERPAGRPVTRRAFVGLIRGVSARFGNRLGGIGPCMQVTSLRHASCHLLLNTLYRDEEARIDSYLLI